MELKGMAQLRKHVPDLETFAGQLRFGLTLLAFIALVTLFFLWVDRVFAEWMPDGEIIFLALGFLIMARFFSQKRVYQKKFGELAYRNAFLRLWLPGLGILFGAIAHLGFMPGPEIPNVWWRPVLIWGGWIFLLVGAALWLRSLLEFGLDNLALVYVYFPDEGQMVDSNIYSVLRHPVYAGLLRIGIGLALLNANWFALLVAILLPLGFTGWVRLVEEKELLERFPDYAAYRRRVPAFWPKLTDLGKFWRFLITGG